MFSITFSNPFGDWITLEIRAGSNQNCDANAVVFNSQLAPGADYSLNTGDSVVCYRRTANPGQPGSPMQPNWNTFSPDPQNTPASIQL